MQFTYREHAVLLALIATMAFAIGPVHAQDAAPVPTCADSVRSALGTLVGHWQLRSVFRTRAGGWDTTGAQVHIAPDLDGCLLRETYIGTRLGQPYEVLSLWSAHGMSAGAAIQRVTGHSQHGLLALYAGEIIGDSLVLAHSQTVRGQPVLFHHIFSPFGADSMRFTSRRSTDDGATWRITWLADYRRRPAR